MIFLDNASTTRVFGEAITVMNELYGEDYFNPSARYSAATKVRAKLETARKELASLLGVSADELFFTSGATESNTWAIQCGFKNKKGNFVVSCGEHASVYENAMSLKNKGFDVRFVPLTKDGVVDIGRYESLIDEQTCLISTIHCNNETGAVNDVKTLCKIAKQRNPNVIFHADGVQAFCKIGVDLASLGVDLYSISAHKIGGPKGVGALYIRKGLKLAPYVLGGGQEKGARSGTENAAGIVGFAKAADIFKKRYVKESIDGLRRLLIRVLKDAGGTVHCEKGGSAHILSVSFEGIKSEILQSLLADEEIYIGIGSACSGNSKNNRVLKEMGIPQKQIEGSVRISLGVENTMNEVEFAANAIKEKVLQLRGKTVG